MSQLTGYGNVTAVYGGDVEYGCTLANPAGADVTLKCIYSEDVTNSGGNIQILRLKQHHLPVLPLMGQSLCHLFLHYVASETAEDTCLLQHTILLRSN